MSDALREIIASFSTSFDTKDLEHGHGAVGQMVETLESLGKTVIAAFGIEKIAEFGAELIHQAKEVEESSIALGVATDELQKLHFAADIAGISAEELNGHIARLNRVAGKSVEGGGQAAAFKKLGIELKDASGHAKSGGELFGEVAESIAGIQSPTERAAVASEIFGRGYARLLPLLAKGKEGIQELKDEAEELGVVFDEAFIQQASETEESFKKLKAGFRGFAIQALTPLLPMLLEFEHLALDITKDIREFTGHTKIFSAVLVGLGAKAIGGVITALPKLIGMFGGFRAVVLETLAPIFALEDVLVFLAGGDSEIGAIMDAAFGKGTQEQVRGTINEAKQGLQEMLGTAQKNAPEFDRVWTAALKDMKRELKDTFGGDVILAFEDAGFASIKALSGGFSGFGRFVLGVLHGIVFQFELAWDDIEYGALIAVAHVEDAFVDMENALTDKIDHIRTNVGNLLSKIPGFGAAGAALVADAAPDQTGGGNVNAVKALAAQRDKERQVEAENIAGQLGLQGYATAPAANENGGVHQENHTEIHQHFEAGTSQETAAAAAGGAEAGVKKGVDLQAAQRALKKTAVAP